MKSVILREGREKSLLRRHPWIFSGAIERVEGEPGSGDTVEIKSASGEWLARGSISPKSQITVRVWTFNAAEEIGPEFFRSRLELALEARGLFGRAAGFDRPHPADEGAQSALRLVNAESDGLPGVAIDRYGEFLVVQILTAGAELWRKTLAAELERMLAPAGMYERSDVDVREKEGLEKRAGVMAGREPPDLIEIREGPCRYLVDVKRGHKTGFYLDQRENRALMPDYAPDAEVLNCFSYTGGFGIAALKARAAKVTNLDSSGPVLGLARRNFDLNGLDPSKVEYVAGDAFEVLRQWRDAERRFDVVILDPPKFVESTSQLTRASRGYKDINLLAFKLLRRGGVLFTFSCSGLMSTELFQKIVADAALDAGREARIVRRLAQAADHPTLLSFPEAGYLKGLVCKVGI
jgi:23S rRNA (cytosine1962-C5)-methyltransferase